MHLEVTKFIEFVQKMLPEYFIDKKVLDVGAGDINGNNRTFFTNCEYDGNDVIAAPNVTIVSKTKDLYYDDNTFDTIISTECFEHDMEYKESLLKIYDMLKPGGLFVFTCASTGRKEHGTFKSDPNASYATMYSFEKFGSYYKNLTKKDIDDVLFLRKNFIEYNVYYNNLSKDLYFVGIKNNLNHEYVSKFKNYSSKHILLYK